MSGFRGKGFWKDGPLWRQRAGMLERPIGTKLKVDQVRVPNQSRRRRLELKRLHALAKRPVDLRPRISKKGT